MTDHLIGFHGIVVLIITVLALALYSRQNIPIATTSLILLVTIPLFFCIFPMHTTRGTLDPTVFFAGFGNEALIAIVALMIAGGAIVRTGALEPLGRFLGKVWGWSAPLAFLLVLVITAFLSAFVNDTPLVVLLIPLLTGIALRAQKPVSRMLMPLGFAALMGGMATTIGTSTNLVVVSIAQKLGLPPMGMFHFTIPTLIADTVGLLYLWLVAPRLLPNRETPLGDRSPRVFTATLHINENSEAVGKKLMDIQKLAEGMRVIQIIREGRQTLVPFPDMEINVGDALVIRDYADRLKEYEEVLKATLYNGEQAVSDENPLQAKDQQLAEVVVMPNSPLSGRSLKNSFFSLRYNLFPLGIYRHGASVKSQNIEEEVLRSGDVILTQGARENLGELRKSGDLTLLDATLDLPRSSKSNLTLILMLAIVLPAAMNLLPIAVTAPAGVLLMLVTGCIEWRQVGASVNTTVILLIAAGIALSMALVKTNAGHFLAAEVLIITRGLPPTLLVAAILYFVALLGNIASHTTGALIGAPISVQIAHGLHLSPEPFLLAVLFGANLGYATPMAYQTNILTMNAAGYVFTDFFRVGLPLLLIMGAIISYLLPVFFPF